MSLSVGMYHPSLVLGAQIGLLFVVLLVLEEFEPTSRALGV